MAEQYSCAFDVGTLLHNLLFSYQKAAKDLLGDADEIFVHPTLDLLLRIEDRANLKLVSSKSAEEALANFSVFLINAQVLKNFSFVKSPAGKYVVSVEGCVWAKHIHNDLAPKDVVCPWAMIAMAIVQKFNGERLKESSSEYLEDGSKTLIEPLRFGFSKEEAYSLAKP